MRQNATPGELSPGQTQALAALLEGKTVTQAAERAGVCRQTVHGWLRDDPAFVAEYNSGRHELVQGVRDELRALAGEAVRLLRETITTLGVPRALRVRAALAVLKMVGADTPEQIDSGDPGVPAPSVRKPTVRKPDEAGPTSVRPRSPPIFTRAAEHCA